ncbi:MAG: hypothetical protein FJ086_13380 [Deltaproteobacteria bacterium]|nr:hypothetical protein [Deltaproteobacteria bacterium]
MSPEAKRAWWGGGLSAALLAWLYGGDLSEHLQAQGAEVYAAVAPPDVVFAGVVLAALAVCLGAAGWGLWKRQGPAWKGYRLLPILAVLALFMDLFMVHGEAQRLPSHERLSAALDAFAAEVTLKSTPEAVLADPQGLEQLARGLGPPGYLVRGKPLEAFRVEVKTGCEGPAAPAPGTPAGTLVYCVAQDRMQAWVTASALAAGRRAGSPEPFTQGGTLVSAVASTPPRPPKTDPETGLPLVPSQEGADAGGPGAPVPGASASPEGGADRKMD